MEEACGFEQLFATKQFAEQSGVNSEEKKTKEKINKMSSVEKYLKATEFLMAIACFLSTCCETQFLEKT